MAERACRSCWLICERLGRGRRWRRRRFCFIGHSPRLGPKDRPILQYRRNTVDMSRLNETSGRAKTCRPTYPPIFLPLLPQQRGIAGSLIWVNFDRHALLDLVWKLGGQFVANIDDVRPQFNSSQNVYLSQSAIFQSTLVRGAAGQPSAGAPIQALNGTLNTPMTAVDGMKQLAKPWYSDQILPFDITLAGASELGAATAMKIFGVEILNEGSGVSIVAEVTKMQATFVARTGASRRK